MARNQFDQTHDDEMLFKDAGLVAADAAAQVDGSDKRVDLGLSRFDGVMHIDVSAIEVASGDESYRIKVQLSNSATFASGVIGGPQLHLGDSSILIGESADSTTGHYELPFCNEVNGTLYRYARVYTDVAGNIATGINFVARAVKKA